MKKSKLLKTLSFFVLLLLSVKFWMLYKKDFFIEAIILLAFIIILFFIYERLKNFHTKVCEAKKTFDQATKKFEEEEKINYSKENLNSCHPSDFIALQMRRDYFTEDFEEEKRVYNDFMGKYPKFLINIINKIL